MITFLFLSLIFLFLKRILAIHHIVKIFLSHLEHQKWLSWTMINTKLIFWEMNIFYAFLKIMFLNGHFCQNSFLYPNNCPVLSNTKNIFQNFLSCLVHGKPSTNKKSKTWDICQTVNTNTKHIFLLCFKWEKLI